MSKFYPRKHHWWEAVEGNLKGKSKSGTASFSITCKQEKMSEFITNLIVRNHDRKEKLAQKQRMYSAESMSFIIVTSGLFPHKWNHFVDMLTEAS